MMVTFFCFTKFVYAEIRIGLTSGFTGPVRAGVHENWLGAQLYIEHINNNGGIYNEKINILKKDDYFDPERARLNAKKLIEDDKVLAMFLARGTPHVEAIFPLLNKHGVAIVGPSTGAKSMWFPFQKYVFNVRPSYQYEASKTIEHLSAMSLGKIGIVYVEDSFGKDALQGYKIGFSKMNREAVFVESFSRENPAFFKVIELTKRQQPNAIVFAGSSGAVVQGIEALRSTGWEGVVATLSNNASDGFIKQLGKNAPGVIVSQVFPWKPLDKNSTFYEMTELLKTSGDPSPVSPAMMEGFVAAKVLVQGIKNAGPNVTRERLLRSLNSLQMKIDGLDLKYTSTNHEGLTFAELSIITGNGTFRR
jgi:branched-chain amino acid transport system substrate-binding protein